MSEEDPSSASNAVRDDIDQDTDEESECGSEVILEISEIKEDMREKYARPSSQKHTVQGNDISRALKGGKVLKLFSE